MGEIDIDILMDINKEIKKLDTDYSFTVDEGKYETAIQFEELTLDTVRYAHPPWAKNWESNPEVLCPDLLDYSNKLIIEYEEEGQQEKPGAALASKGHGQKGDITNNADTNRDYLYRIAGFKLLKIWEAEYEDGSYVENLKNFLNFNSIAEIS